MLSSTSLQAIAAGDLLEVVPVERIQAEADAAQAGVAQGAGLLREEKAVGGHRQVRDAGNARDARDQIFDIVAQERFAAGQPDLLDAQADGERGRRVRFPRRSGGGFWGTHCWTMGAGLGRCAQWPR